MLAIRRRVFGADSEPVGRSIANMAAVHQIAGDDAAGEPLYRQPVELLGRFLGADHPELAGVLVGQSESLRRLGKLEDEERAVRHGLKIRLTSFPSDSPQVAAARLRLGQILSARKEYREADELLRLAAESYRKNKGISDAHTQKAIRARIDLYRSWGRTEEARAQEALLAENAGKLDKR